MTELNDVYMAPSLQASLDTEQYVTHPWDCIFMGEEW